jgi:hypothetical protein
LLTVISLGENAGLKMGRAIDVWAPWLPRDEASALLDHVNRMPSQDRKPSALSLGQRLRVTNAERERLKLWTIFPCDMSEEQMAEQKKAKDRARKRSVRDKLGQPWIAQGISRATGIGGE